MLINKAKNNVDLEPGKCNEYARVESGDSDHRRYLRGSTRGTGSVRIASGILLVSTGLIGVQSYFEDSKGSHIGDVIGTVAGLMATGAGLIAWGAYAKANDYSSTPNITPSAPSLHIQTEHSPESFFERSRTSEIYMELSVMPPMGKRTPAQDAKVRSLQNELDSLNDLGGSN